MLPVTEGAVAAEDGAAVAEGAGDRAATTEQEGVAEGDKPQGEEKEADVSQVTHASAREYVKGIRDRFSSPIKASLLQPCAPRPNQ